MVNEKQLQTHTHIYRERKKLLLFVIEEESLIVVAMAGTSTPHFFLLFLGISHLVYFNNAIPITRIGRLMQEPQLLPIQANTPKEVKDQITEEKMMIPEERMVLQLNDYPGSGANHRHTPWPPQLAKACVDC